jgi:hypothetical protein
MNVINYLISFLFKDLFSQEKVAETWSELAFNSLDNGWVFLAYL